MIRKSVSRLLFLIIFLLIIINPANLAYGYSLDTIVMCDDVDPNKETPVGIGYTYSTDSGLVYCWVNFTDVEGSLAVKFEWFDPEDDLYRSNIIYTFPASYEVLPVFNFMKVTGSRAASKLGLWEVNVTVNDIPVAETDFMLVDYTTLFDTIIGLETSVMELTFAKEQISQQHDSLQGEYNQLSDAYDKLRAQIDEYNQSSVSLITDYEELLTEYEELSESIDQLQSDYNDLLLDYNEQDQSSLETKRELENTQRILIISIAISIFLLILYMKRRVSN
jgi:hypothetical protein